MKIGDIVGIMVGRQRRMAFGVLIEADQKRGAGVVMVSGVRFVRDLKRIKTLDRGQQLQSKQLRRNSKAWSHVNG